ncbi:MAG: hypothetical protein Q9205_001273 [Flavoplaca limonia]
MRHAMRLLASPSTLGSSSGFNPAPLTLLPPIPLYRRILRAHRKFLKPDERTIGDEYVKSEFRSHRNVENPIHIVGFLNEWQRYTQQVEGESWQGTKLDTDKIDKMSGPYTPTRALEMCTVKKTMCRKCRKRWFKLVSPCGEGKNLETCPSFKDNRWRSEQQYTTAMVNADNCPSCTPAKFDGNQTRFIESESKGVKFGLRPPRPTAGDPNVKIYCCTMM